MSFSNRNAFQLQIICLFGLIVLISGKTAKNQTLNPTNQKQLNETIQLNETLKNGTNNKGFLGFFKSKEETKVFWLMTSLVIITLFCFFFLMKKFHTFEYEQTETFDKLEFGTVKERDLRGPTILEYFKQKNPLLRWKISSLQLEENRPVHSEKQPHKKIFSDM